MQFLTNSLYLFIIGLFSGCIASKSLQKDKDSSSDSNQSLLIYIQQGTCLGKCPQYEATFFTGNKMVYHGKKHMPLIGKYEFYVKDDHIKNLIYEAIKRNVKTIPDSMAIPPDVPQTRIWVVINGKLKKTTGWIGGENEIFKNYAEFLQAEVKALISDQEGKKIP